MVYRKTEFAQDLKCGRAVISESLDYWIYSTCSFLKYCQFALAFGSIVKYRPDSLDNAVALAAMISDHKEEAQVREDHGIT